MKVTIFLEDVIVPISVATHLTALIFTLKIGRFSPNRLIFANFLPLGEISVLCVYGCKTLYVFSR